MITYYKKKIFSLKDSLNAMPDNLKFRGNSLIDSIRIYDYQIDVLNSIKSAEKKLSKEKSFIGKLRQTLRSSGLAKDESSKIKSKIDHSLYKIDGYSNIIYIFKCFCDALVFKYTPKWNIHHFQINQHRFALKETPGFITEKSGFWKERKRAIELARKGFVPLLNDLTNVMRHGDISLLGNEIPLPIEVKSSKNRNRRTERQFQSLKIIKNFYRNDGGDISGFQGIKRVFLRGTEKNYTELMNSTVQEALKTGSCISTPEAGVRYLAATGDASRIINESCDEMQEPVACYVNSFKSIEKWRDYTPFTLSFQKPDTLYAFLSGNLILIVFVDLSVLREKAEAIGVNVTRSEDNDYIFKLNIKNKTVENFDYIYVSRHFFGRVFLEFMPIDIILDNIHST
ncbi:hypothetical protein [Desulfovibrio sp. QI0434]